MDAASSPTLEDDYEALLGFVYLCPVGVLQLDDAGMVQMANPQASQMLMPLLTVPMLDNLFDCLERHAPEIRNMAAAFSEPRGSICKNHRIHISHASNALLVLTCTLLRIQPGCMMAVLNDVSAQVAQEQRLQQAESWFGTLLAGVNDFALFSLDRDGRIDSWNDSAERHTGRTSQEVLGSTLQQFYGADAASQDRAIRQISSARREGWAVEEGSQVNPDGIGIWMQSLVAAVREKDGDIYGFSVVMRDITKRKLSTEELRRLLTTDYLTGATNRARLFDLGEIEIARWKRHGTPLAAILFDADHFKRINDTMGHQAGDTVLRALVERCRKGLRAVDTLARYGGEEFVVLLPGQVVDEALVVAERLRHLVCEQPMKCGDTSVSVTISLGCAGIGEGLDSLEALLAAADAAAYNAKRLGRNRAEVYQLSQS